MLDFKGCATCTGSTWCGEQTCPLLQYSPAQCLLNFSSKKRSLWRQTSKVVWDVMQEPLQHLLEPRKTFLTLSTMHSLVPSSRRVFICFSVLVCALCHVFPAHTSLFIPCLWRNPFLLPDWRSDGEAAISLCASS